MSRATISTHVLDLSTGKPGADVGVTLATADGTLVGEERTDAEGRIAQLVPDGVAPGEYQLLFELEDYFVERPHLFQMVTLEVLIDEERHYHIPLLVSDFGISSYRGR